ncbi:MAG: IPT/TIG domain-containing protein [Cyclobacteriaceae bacterium]
MMKIQLSILAVLIFSTTILMNCNDAEILTKEFPLVIMEDVRVNQNSVEFLAEIKDHDSQPIAGHGFIWSRGSAIDSTELFYKRVSSFSSTGSFNLIVSSDLQADEYTVRPYVLTENLTVIGNKISFLGQGSFKPVIEGFSPRSGDSGDTITITGDNFSLAKSRIEVFIGNDKANVISTDFEEIRFTLPQRLSVSAAVPFTVTSGEYTIQLNELFLITGHQITSFSPTNGIIGETEIVIKGTGFQASENVVRFGGHDAIILEEKESELKVKLPYTMEVGDAFVEVEIGGKVAMSENVFSVKSRWSRLNDFPGDARTGSYFDIVNDYGYLIGGGGEYEFFNDVWRYTPSSDEWVSLEPFPGSARSMAVGFSIGNRIFFGMGLHSYQRFVDFWEYNPELQEWTQLSDFPGLPRYDPIQFVLNDKGYVIGGDIGISGSREVWEYDPDTDSWEQLGSISRDFARYLDGRDIFFQSENKGYFVENSVLYEFDPSNPVFLIEIAETPFDPNDLWGYASGFIIENKIYIGGGEHVLDYNRENKFWIYNLDVSEWDRIESFQGSGRSRTNTLSKDSYGYLMFGFNSYRGINNYLPEVWRYDPLE